MIGDVPQDALLVSIHTYTYEFCIKTDDIELKT